MRYFEIDNQAVSFEALFSGSPFSLYVPIAAVLAIYARENGRGMFFDANSDLLSDDEDAVKEGSNEADEQPTVLRAVDTDTNVDPVDPDDEPPKPPASGRPSLRIIK